MKYTICIRDRWSILNVLQNSLNAAEQWKIKWLYFQLWHKWTNAENTSTTLFLTISEIEIIIIIVIETITSAWGCVCAFEFVLIAVWIFWSTVRIHNVWRLNDWRLMMHLIELVQFWNILWVFFELNDAITQNRVIFNYCFDDSTWIPIVSIIICSMEWECLQLTACVICDRWYIGRRLIT